MEAKQTKVNSLEDNAAREPWIKPEIASFAPAKAAEGISYQRGDGIANLTV